MTVLTVLYLVYTICYCYIFSIHTKLLVCTKIDIISAETTTKFRITCLIMYNFFYFYRLGANALFRLMPVLVYQEKVLGCQVSTAFKWQYVLLWPAWHWWIYVFVSKICQSFATVQGNNEEMRSCWIKVLYTIPCQNRITKAIRFVNWTLKLTNPSEHSILMKNTFWHCQTLSSWCLFVLLTYLFV